MLTNISVYNSVQNCLVNKNYHKIKSILASVVSGIQEKQKYGVKKLSKPIYYGVNAKTFNLDNYKQNSIGFWPVNIRATKSKSLAKYKSKCNFKNEAIVYFKIFLTSYNNTISAIELDPSQCTTT